MIISSEGLAQAVQAAPVALEMKPMPAATRSQFVSGYGLHRGSHTAAHTCRPVGDHFAMNARNSIV